MDPSLAVLSYLAELTLRSVLVAVPAWLALAVSRTRSAAFGHAVWTVVAAGMLGLALLHPILPPVAVPVLPARPQAGLAPVAPRILTPLPTAVDLPAVAAPDLSRTAPQPPPAPAPTPARAPLRLRSVDLLCAVYAVGVLLFLGRLLFGYLFARRLVRSGAPVDLPAGLTAGCVVLESSWISVPMTIGVLRPSVLLPAEWRQWPEGKLRSVLAHEFTHVARRDWLVTLLAGANRAVFWFHPLAWWLERRLADLAEQACDDAALLVCGDPAAYARTVLDMAEAVRAGQGRLTWEAMAMAKPSLVGRRIDRILDDTRQLSQAVGRWGWPAMAACALPLVAGAAVLRLTPENLPALPSRPAAPAPMPLLAVPRPAPERAHVVAQLPPRPAAPAPQSATQPEVRAFISDLVPIQRTQPVMPEAARNQNWQPDVRVLVTLDPQGHPVKAEPLTGPTPLRTAAEAAVKQWLYRPVLREGQSVYAMTQAFVYFRLPPGTPPTLRRPMTEAERDEMSEASHRVYMLGRAFPRSPAQILADLEQDVGPATGKDRFYRLCHLAKFAANAGQWEKAESYATELLAQMGQDPQGWNYGNAIHDSNMVLGRVALRRGNIAGARERLLEAGRTPGSPQLNSFGPNVTLAKELIEHNEREAVLEYFTLCRSFWKMHDGRLDAWSAMVRGGGMPDFGANLLY